jgi:ring-1,2-phenylacetyl-CoA epoxidase subunit PaaB
MNKTIDFRRYGDYGDRESAGSMEQHSEKGKLSKSEAGSKASPSGGGLEGAEWPLWEVFIRSKQGLDHKHVGSLHAADAQMAIENARDVYTRRMEGVSIWVVESQYIHASNPDEAESMYDPASDKVYRHPTFYDLPDEVKHM